MRSQRRTRGPGSLTGKAHSRLLHLGWLSHLGRRPLTCIFSLTLFTCSVVLYKCYTILLLSHPALISTPVAAFFVQNALMLLPGLSCTVNGSAVDKPLKPQPPVWSHTRPLKHGIDHVVAPVCFLL